MGSSPLTRGKRACRCRRFPHKRLIPAHAGKTRRLRYADLAVPAHPRSRGENSASRELEGELDGSSPLTRGKRVGRVLHRDLDRLIPAHAGKTRHGPPGRAKWEAHPRSRGENGLCRKNEMHVIGSSPLTRGKRPRTRTPIISPRLIPAHAGKTRDPARQTRGRQAHPRSRGENVTAPLITATRAGSSPLTRGKRVLDPAEDTRGRLIPAHAGKTGCRP